MRAFCILLLSVAAAFSDEVFHLSQPASHFGMCDASGAVAVSSNRFLVANDEDNILRVYDSRTGGPPLQEFNMDAFLELEPGSPEADLEAGTRVGDRVYWIGSHGRNQSGKRRSNRCRFFATDISVKEDLVSLAPVGQPCKHLLDDLLADRTVRAFGLAKAAKRTPKQPDALDIEGLTATPDGSLLIGFRNPIPEDKALLVPLLNPNDVIVGAHARFGSPILLDLHGLGVRDITLCGQEFLIIAGRYDSKHHFEFFFWGGPGKDPVQLKTDPVKGFNPEALLVYAPGRPKAFQLLSDDGTRLVDGASCKELKDPMKRVFRSFWLNAE